MTGGGVTRETACSEIMQFTMECRWLVPSSADSRAASCRHTVTPQGDRKLRFQMQFASSGEGERARSCARARIPMRSRRPHACAHHVRSALVRVHVARELAEVRARRYLLMQVWVDKAPEGPCRPRARARASYWPACPTF